MRICEPVEAGARSALGLEISGNDQDLGVIVCLAPGSIRGNVHRKMLDLPFAEGQLHLGESEDFMPFHTDAEGNFHLTGLPPGEAEIVFTRFDLDVVEDCHAAVKIEPGKESVIADGDFKGSE